MFNKTVFRINKNGESEWHTVEAITAQDAIEQYFNVRVYPCNKNGDPWIFDSLDQDQLYAATELNDA